MAGKYKVKAGQSIFDVALVVYGHTEGVTWLISDNNLDWNTPLSTGTQLKLREGKVDPKIVEFYDESEHFVGTAVNLAEFPITSGDFNFDFSMDFY